MSGRKVLSFEKEEIVQDKSTNEVFNFAKLKANLEIEVVKN